MPGLSGPVIKLAQGKACHLCTHRLLDDARFALIVLQSLYILHAVTPRTELLLVILLPYQCAVFQCSILATCNDCQSNGYSTAYWTKLICFFVQHELAVPFLNSKPPSILIICSVKEYIIQWVIFHFRVDIVGTSNNMSAWHYFHGSDSVSIQ